MLLYNASPQFVQLLVTETMLSLYKGLLSSQRIFVTVSVNCWNALDSFLRTAERDVPSTADDANNANLPHEAVLIEMVKMEGYFERAKQSFLLGSVKPSISVVFMPYHLGLAVVYSALRMGKL